jgi:hypothetical protein
MQSSQVHQPQKFLLMSLLIQVNILKQIMVWPVTHVGKHSKLQTSGMREISGQSDINLVIS